MKVKTIFMLAATLATAVIVLSVPAIFAQRGGGAPSGPRGGGAPAAPRGGGAPSAPRGGGAPVAQRGNGTFVAAPRVIQPMGNPVPPMLPTPFVRYSDHPATVVHPGQGRGNRGDYGPGNGGGRGQRGSGRDWGYLAATLPTYYYPPSYYGYPSLYYDYYPGLEPVPVIPGQLPGSRYYEYPARTSDEYTPSDVSPTPSAEVYVPQPQNEFYSEPRLIINEPRPDRVVVPPAIGTPRSDVIAQFGQPWGTFTVRGEETLYFDGLTVVIAADGRVIRVR